MTDAQVAVVVRHVDDSLHHGLERHPLLGLRTHTNTTGVSARQQLTGQDFNTNLKALITLLVFYERCSNASALKKTSAV